jgi:hypothetical protein
LYPTNVSSLCTKEEGKQVCPASNLLFQLKHRIDQKKNTSNDSNFLLTPKALWMPKWPLLFWAGSCDKNM